MKQLTHHQMATYLTDYVLSELVKYFIEDTGCSVEQAMERVYNSPLMTLLSRRRSRTLCAKSSISV